MTPENWPEPDGHAMRIVESTAGYTISQMGYAWSEKLVREIVRMEVEQLKLDADEMVRQMLTEMTAAIPLLDLHPDDYFEAMNDARKWLKENKDAD